MTKTREPDVPSRTTLSWPAATRPWVEAERVRGWAWRVMVVYPLARLLHALWRRAKGAAAGSPKRYLSPYAVGAGLIGLALVTAAVVSGADHRVACAAAERAVQEKLQPLLRRGEEGAAWLVANTVASSRTARGYCAGDRPDMGLTIYRRIIATLDSYAPTVETAFQFGTAPPKE